MARVAAERDLASPLDGCGEVAVDCHVRHVHAYDVLGREVCLELARGEESTISGEFAYLFDTLFMREGEGQHGIGNGAIRDLLVDR